MKYNDITEAKFIRRDNRFTATVEIDGRQELCHVRNTGRCKELLVEGAKVYIEPSSSENRKTKYTLISVEKNGKLINMDSQAPNKVVEEAINNKAIFENATLLKKECRYNKSRFDFYMECGDEKAFIEVKGVTHESHNIASFPDAPSLRASKHLEELMQAVNDGYNAYLLFVVQMNDVSAFVPNDALDMYFGIKLDEAIENGVKVIVYGCDVSKDEIVLNNNKIYALLQNHNIKF